MSELHKAIDIELHKLHEVEKDLKELSKSFSNVGNEILAGTLDDMFLKVVSSRIQIEGKISNVQNNREIVSEEETLFEPFKKINMLPLNKNNH